MEQALIFWAQNYVAKKYPEFIPISTPDLARVEILEGCGFNPRDESSQVYHLEKNKEKSESHMCLIGTAEIPLVGMYQNETLDRDLLPCKFLGLSHCYRKEAGRGEHSKGLYRLH